MSIRFLFPLLVVMGCTNSVNPASLTVCDAAAHQTGSYQAKEDFTTAGTCIGVPDELLVMNLDHQTFIDISCAPPVEDTSSCNVLDSNCTLLVDDSICVGYINLSFAGDGATAVATDFFNCHDPKTGFACQSTYTINFVKQ